MEKKKLKKNEVVSALLRIEAGPNPAAQLAVKLGVTEQYIRMIALGKYSPGWRLWRDIDALYKKVVEK